MKNNPYGKPTFGIKNVILIIFCVAAIVFISKFPSLGMGSGEKSPAQNAVSGAAVTATTTATK